MAEKEVAREFVTKADKSGAEAAAGAKEADKKSVKVEDKPLFDRPVPRHLLKYVV